MIRFLFVLILVTFFVASCARNAQQVPAQGASSCRIAEIPQVRAHWQAFIARDIPTIRAQYASSADVPGVQAFQAYYAELDANQGEITSIEWYGTCQTTDGAISFYVQHVHHPTQEVTVWYVVETNPAGLILQVS